MLERIRALGKSPKFGRGSLGLGISSMRLLDARPSFGGMDDRRLCRIGAAAAIAGAVLLASTASPLALTLEVLLIAAGLDLVVTGALGHCPLYAKLGHTPRSLQRPA